VCDTFVHIGKNADQTVVTFGKNSDREPNEAQILEYHPPQTYQPGEEVKCTYLSIPQVKETQGVLISRPFWMWGAEIGVNDAGVSIGNEAVFTKMSMTLEKKLLGMDMLRLALERSASAENAVETIVALLGDHGQGGPCGFQDKKLAYHNSFIISDHQEAWVLETAGPFWAARKIDGYYAISNGLTIESEYDISHPDLISNATKKGWLKKGVEFSFKKTYSDWFITTFSRCAVRRLQTENKIKEKALFSVEHALKALRNHNGNDNYSPDSHAFMNSVCSHAGLPLSRHASQSTASMISESINGETTVWATGTSAPCLSIFKPIWLSSARELPDLAQNTGADYHKNSFWWGHELFHREILKDYPVRSPKIRNSIAELEEKFLNKVRTSNEDERSLITREAFEMSNALKDRALKDLRSALDFKKQQFVYRKYWASQNKKARLVLS